MIVSLKAPDEFVLVTFGQIVYDIANLSKDACVTEIRPDYQVVIKFKFE